MAVDFIPAQLAYGLSQPTIPVMPMVQRIPTAPTGSTRGVLGQIVIAQDTEAVYMLTSVSAGNSTWSGLTGSSGIFTSLLVTGISNFEGVATFNDNVVIPTGNLTVTAGALNVGGVATIENGLVVNAGGIDVTAGIVTAPAFVGSDGVYSSANLFAGGDDGVGLVANTSFTNATNTTQGAGNLTILSTNGNSGDNTGFIKIYVGTTEAWVPYFTDIAP
jgi:hypothetical protein